MAIAFDPRYATDLKMYAFRQKGILADAFVKAYLVGIRKNNPGNLVSIVVVHGKRVYTFSPNPSKSESYAIVPRDDVTFIVSSLDGQLVEAAIGALP